MKNKLKRIKIEKAWEIVNDKELVEKIKTRNERIFEVSRSGRTSKEERNPLLEVEIALSRCERVGLFRNR